MFQELSLSFRRIAAKTRARSAWALTLSHSCPKPLKLSGVLNEFLINPMAPIVAPPDFSKDEPARDRSPRDKDGPQMPSLSPARRRAQVHQVMIIAVSDHARPLSKDSGARRPLAPVQKRAPENRSLFFPHRLTKDSYLLRVAL